MKIIFSRKGFDSGYGGVASPILPDGRLLSLPIPYPDSLRTFGSVLFDGQPLSAIVQPLTKHRYGAPDSCHLDPDLRPEAVARSPGWRPMFGQVGAAQSHLQNQGVGVGDLFLFFGWFKQTKVRDGQLAFSAAAPDLHVLYGWLQVSEIHSPTAAFWAQHPWAKAHPHCLENGWKENNTVYLATPELVLPGLKGPALKGKIPGGGVFPQFNRCLQLTAPDCTRTVWHLPAWMHPQGRDSGLSYHGNPDLWQHDGDRTRLKSRSKGQEFVLNVDHYPEAIAWVAELFEQQQFSF